MLSAGQSFFQLAFGIGFNGEELAIARAAVSVMDRLITQDRRGIADRAERGSFAQMRSLRSTGKSAPQRVNP